MYENLIIIHSLDNSTQFLSKFKDAFPHKYKFIDEIGNNADKIKQILGDLEERSLIIYLGHGSSEGLYLPDENNDYKNLFLDVNWGNHFFENHDIIFLSCNSNKYIERIFTYHSALGFGNIISSENELKHHNKYHETQKILTKEDIDLFNSIYVNVSINIVQLLINGKIKFQQVYQYYSYFLNKEINTILLNKKLVNRVEISRLLFELRNEINFRSK